MWTVGSDVRMQRRHALTADLSPFISGDLSQIRYFADYFMVNI